MFGQWTGSANFIPTFRHASDHQVHCPAVDPSLQPAFFTATAFRPYSSSTRIYTTRGLRFVRVCSACQCGIGHTPSSSLNPHLQVPRAHRPAVSAISRRVHRRAAGSEEGPFGRVSASNLRGMASGYIGPVYSTTIIESVPTCRFWRPKKTSQSGQKTRKLIVRIHLASFHSRWSRTHLEAGRVGVVPVHLNPHPRRTHHPQGNSFPVQLRYSTPTFDKSNVLVLYVLRFLTERSE